MIPCAYCERPLMCAGCQAEFVPPDACDAILTIFVPPLVTDAVDVAAYFGRIGYQGPAERTVETVHALVRERIQAMRARHRAMRERYRAYLQARRARTGQGGGFRDRLRQHRADTP